MQGGEIHLDIIDYCEVCGLKKEDMNKYWIWMGIGKKRVLVQNPNFKAHTCFIPSRTWKTFWHCIREFGEGIKG